MVEKYRVVFDPEGLPGSVCEVVKANISDVSIETRTSNKHLLIKPRMRRVVRKQKVSLNFVEDTCLPVSDYFNQRLR